MIDNEILPVAINSVFHKIPICHLNGGEHTSNSFDDYIRNCLTKLSYYHFPRKLLQKKYYSDGRKSKKGFYEGGLSQDQVKNLI